MQFASMIAFKSTMLLLLSSSGLVLLSKHVIVLYWQQAIWPSPLSERASWVSRSHVQRVMCLLDFFVHSDSVSQLVNIAYPALYAIIILVHEMLACISL